jgi:hypothetical protein
MPTSRLSRAFRRMCVLSVLVGLFGPLLAAQEIHIRVMNAHNGKPIKNDCINVSLGPWHGADLLPATNEDGVVVLHLLNNEFWADSACHGWPARVPRRAGVDAIALIGDRYIACQEYGKLDSGERTTPAASLSSIKERIPSYSIMTILESGVTAGNTCGQFRAEARPGALIFFVRPPTWLEKWKR